MSTLPRHDDIPLRRVILAAVFVAAAAGLMVCHIARLSSLSGIVCWETGIAVIIGMLAADFCSGLIHWTADTWFSESMPILGRRLLRPFRVHHVNPDDILRRGFVTLNGDVAVLGSGFLIAVFAVPLDVVWGRFLAVILVSMAFTGLPTNQVHQWAHMRQPPGWVHWLQRWRIILRRQDHLRHHRRPYADYYCIATGWLNRPLGRIGFFCRAERVVTALTNLRPRDDDQRFDRQTEDA